jgi:hypothetical protein
MYCTVEVLPISWDTEDEESKQSSLGSLAQSRRMPHAAEILALAATTTFSATVSEIPEPVMTALMTLSFHSPSRPDFSPV